MAEFAAPGRHPARLFVLWQISRAVSRHRISKAPGRPLSKVKAKEHMLGRILDENPRCQRYHRRLAPSREVNGRAAGIGEERVGSVGSAWRRVGGGG